MKSTLFFTLLASLLITSCNPAGEKSNQDTESEVNRENTTEAVDSFTELGLDNGEKWPVNPEMMVHVAASDSLVQNFDPAGADSHELLAAELEENKNRLISACTMKGPAHDALHLWLMPYIGHIGYLAKAETAAEKEQAVAELRGSFDTFHSHFE